MFVALGVALLAGAGLLLTLTNQPARRARVLGALALGVMLFAGWHGPLELVAVEPRPVDGWLAGQRNKSGESPALMILQVHDELVFEADAGFVDALKAEVIARMASAAELAVPLVVDCGVGDNWDQAH